MSNKITTSNFKYTLLLSCSLAASLPCYGMEKDGSRSNPKHVSSSLLTTQSNISDLEDIELFKKKVALVSLNDLAAQQWIKENVYKTLEAGYALTQTQRELINSLPLEGWLYQENDLAYFYLCLLNGHRPFEERTRRKKIFRFIEDQADDDNNRFCQFLLGYIYSFGCWGEEANILEGCKLLKLSGDQGIIEAYYQLGRLEEEAGQLKQALEYYQKSAQAGHREGKKQYELLHINSLREILKQTDDVSEFITIMAALDPYVKQNHPEALFTYGEVFENGTMFKQNVDIAKKQYKDAANQGHKLAGFALGLLYFKDNNTAEARPYLVKAIENGIPEAEQYLQMLDDKEDKNLEELLKNIDLGEGSIRASISQRRKKGANQAQTLLDLDQSLANNKELERILSLSNQVQPVNVRNVNAPIDSPNLNIGKTSDNTQINEHNSNTNNADPSLQNEIIRYYYTAFSFPENLDIDVPKHVRRQSPPSSIGRSSTVSSSGQSFPHKAIGSSDTRTIAIPDISESSREDRYSHFAGEDFVQLNINLDLKSFGNKELPEVTPVPPANLETEVRESVKRKFPHVSRISAKELEQRIAESIKSLNDMDIESKTPRQPILIPDPVPPAVQPTDPVEREELFNILQQTNPELWKKLYGESPQSEIKGVSEQSRTEQDDFFTWLKNEHLSTDQLHTLGLAFYYGRDNKGQDFKQARHYFELAANQGHKEATYNLAVLYLKGEGGEKNTDRARQLLKKVLEFKKILGTKTPSYKHVPAMYDLGRLYIQELEKEVINETLIKRMDQAFQLLETAYNLVYHTPEGGYVGKVDAKLKQKIKENYLKIKKLKEQPDWIKAYAQSGDEDNQYLLGIMHEERKNIREAFDWYIKAAEQGHQKAQERLFNLSMNYYHGENGIERNEDLSLRGFKVLAKQTNHAHEHYMVGCIYYERQGIPDRSAKAIKWLNKSVHKAILNKNNPLLRAIYGYLGVIYLDKKDYENALNFLNLALTIEKNHAGIQFFIGVVYYHKANYPEAVKWFQKAADQGLKEAQFNLGMLYYHGWGVTQNYQEARIWCQKSADQGLKEAQCNLGIMYHQGQGIEKDYSEAIRWFQKAADQRVKEARFNLGVMYEEGRGGVKQSDSEAMKWYQKAADQGFAAAQYCLGICYKDRKEGGADYEQAKIWFEKGARQNHVGAQNWLGVMSRDGLGVNQDYSEAIRWFQKAADRDYVDAQLNLAELYNDGKGTPQNFKEARKWYQLAADRGIKEAQFNLGIMHAQGQGTVQDYAEAFKWYKKAADQGMKEAQYNLGVLYAEGKGVTQDYVIAKGWFEKAANQGIKEAQYALGVLYAQGQGGPQDYKEARKWYQLAADQNHANAQHNLGVMYAKGQGVPQSDSEAMKWYRLAADQGMKEAQHNLGALYAQGKGVTKNIQEAIRWYQKAADQGFLAAKQALEALAKARIPGAQEALDELNKN